MVWSLNAIFSVNIDIFFLCPHGKGVTTSHLYHIRNCSDEMTQHKFDVSSSSQKQNKKKMVLRRLYFF